MSDLQRSVEDNGVVETALGIVLGLGVLALGVYVRGHPRTGGDPRGPLFIIGFGGLVVLFSAALLVQRLSKLPTRDPVAVVRGDLNDRDEILWGLGKLALFWVVAALFWEFLMRGQSPDYPPLVQLATRPTAVAGWLAITVVFAIAIAFGSHKGGKGRGGRI